MRKRNYLVLISLSVVFTAIILCACGKGEREEIPEKIFGTDYSQEKEFPSLVQVVCDSDGAWIITAAKRDPICRWNPQKPGTGTEQIEWQSDGKYDLVNIAERQGTLYVETRNREDDSFEIRKLRTGGTWSAVMSVRVENREDYAVMGTGFFVDKSENVYLAGGDEVTRFSGEGQQSGSWKLRGKVCLWLENDSGQVECVTAAADGIALYGLTETGAEEKWTIQTSTQRVCGVCTGSGEKLCLAADLELLFVDRETGSLLAKTDTMKMGVSSVLAGYYDETAGTMLLYGSSGSGAEGLKYSQLRERETSEEQRTELVYGMVGGVNNGDSSSIWKAITAFNQTSRDYYVTIKNYDNNVDRLHTDMAAGNGPDIIDMTYTEYYESYAANGYLEDLSPFLEQSQYKDDIIWNILDTYRIDGGLYLFTPQVQLSGTAIHPEYESAVQEWNMEAFLNLVEQNQWNRFLIGGLPGDPEALLLFLLKGSQEEFIDREQCKAFFDTEEFVSMLELCREYAEADWPDIEEWTAEERRHHTLCQEVLFGSGFIDYLHYAGVYGREYPVYGYPAFSGQVYEVISCSDSCAIYSGSDRKEGAWEFIESLLLESNQKYSGITNPGFPVRRSVLEDLEEESKSMELRSGGEMLTITDTEIAILEDILINGRLCSGLLDPDIRSVIQEETAAYFAGDKDAWDVAHIIQSRVEIILQVR